MGKEIIKKAIEMESAEGRNFGTILNLQNVNSRVFSDQIIPQKNTKFTDFLLFECVFCKASLGKENAVEVDDGIACAECFRGLTAKALQILQNSSERPKKVIRLYQCFGCGENLTARKMSGCLAICRNCFKNWQFENERTRQRFIEKTLNKIGGFLRGRI